MSELVLELYCFTPAHSFQEICYTKSMLEGHNYLSYFKILEI